MTQADVIMTSTEVAKYLRLPIRTVYKLCQEGKLPAAKIGKHWRFRKDRVLPVAVIGSSPEREGWDRVVQLDADAYLSKDMSRAEQVARIKALLRRA